MAEATRLKTSCPVYGQAADLPTNQLPTIANVMQLYMEIKSQHSKTTSASKVRTEVAENVIGVWIKAGIPTINLRSTECKIEILYKELRNVMKKKGKNKETAIEELRSNSSNLFDIAACKCSDFSTCSCERDKKIPVEEREFIADQRGARKMVIGAVDRKITSRNLRRNERKYKRDKYYKTQCNLSNISHTSDDDSSSESIDTSSPTPESQSEEVYMQSEGESSSRNQKSLSTLSRECDRYNVSNTVGAAIATAVLVDYGIVTDLDKSSAIDGSKLWRERQRYRDTLSLP